MSAVTKNVCLEAHVTVEKYITYPLQEVLKNLVHHLNPKCKADFGYHNRLILVAQSVISFVVLPFKILVAVFSGIYARYNLTDEKSWVNLTFAFATVALHAVLVPAGLILAFIPETGLGEIKSALETFAKKKTGDKEAAFKPLIDWFEEYVNHIADTTPQPKPVSADVEQEEKPAARDDVRREERGMDVAAHCEGPRKKPQPEESLAG